MVSRTSLDMRMRGEPEASGIYPNPRGDETASSNSPTKDEHTREVRVMLPCRPMACTVVLDTICPWWALSAMQTGRSCVDIVGFRCIARGMFSSSNRDTRVRVHYRC